MMMQRRVISKIRKDKKMKMKVVQPKNNLPTAKKKKKGKVIPTEHFVMPLEMLICPQHNSNSNNQSNNDLHKFYIIMFFIIFLDF